MLDYLAQLPEELGVEWSGFIEAFNLGVSAVFNMFFSRRPIPEEHHCLPGF